jgi:hypothetical protein
MVDDINVQRVVGAFLRCLLVTISAHDTSHESVARIQQLFHVLMTRGIRHDLWTRRKHHGYMLPRRVRKEIRSKDLKKKVGKLCHWRQFVRPARLKNSIPSLASAKHMLRTNDHALNGRYNQSLLRKALLSTFFTH